MKPAALLPDVLPVACAAASTPWTAREPGAAHAAAAVARVGASERGDCEVPEGRYGVGPRDLLRIDGASGAALGVVQRS